MEKDSQFYELRMVDDDGTPDDDMPALDRNRDINKFGIDAVALCTRTLLMLPFLRALFFFFPLKN